jgi:hypothetical protein
MRAHYKMSQCDSPILWVVVRLDRCLTINVGLAQPMKSQVKASTIRGNTSRMSKAVPYRAGTLI